MGSGKLILFIFYCYCKFFDFIIVLLCRINKKKKKSILWCVIWSVISYQGDCLQPDVVNEILDNGVDSSAFRLLITWITTELGSLLDLDEQVCIDSKIDTFVK